MSYTGPDAARIREMFRSIAGRYDRANTVLSAGIHHRWRSAAVAWSGAKPGDQILDCAMGTGDLALAFHRAIGGEGAVVGTDFVPEMLERARQKAAGRSGIRFESADVTALPYESDSFDVASIAFGLRNVSDPSKAVAELARVVRPGGLVLILEFGQPPNRVVRGFYQWYSRVILPRIGGALTGQQDAYSYLERSASRFPCGEELVALMQESAAFSRIDFRTLSLGIAYLYRAVVR